MLEVQGLTKCFGELKAVDDLSFSIQKGEILGFLGPNGAGKTTTMKMVSGFIKPDHGTALIQGFDIRTRRIQAQRLMGYLPENAPSYPEMTVYEFLGFIADIRGFKGEKKKREIERTIELTALNEVYNRIIGRLSKGFRQRVGFAQALLHDPPLLILDEPTDGLDPNQKLEVRSLIRKMAEQKAIILSTHILEEMEAVCSRAIIIHQGRIVADGSPTELTRKNERPPCAVIKLQTNTPELVQSCLLSFNEVDHVERLDDGKPAELSFRVHPGGQESLTPFLFNLAVEKGWKLVELTNEKERLDQVFYDLTKGGFS